LGAIIRTACAFGFDTIFTIDSVYPYSAKAIRSSMGYVFTVNFVDVDYSQLEKIKKNNNILFYAADMDGEIIDDIVVNAENVAVIIGNEGQGVSKELRLVADKTVAIPMKNNVESLNASVSASIIMYFLR
jgi:TrmH family RNA methyltransferase